MVAFDHERPWSPYWFQELWSGPADAGREARTGVRHIAGHACVDDENAKNTDNGKL